MAHHRGLLGFLGIVGQDAAPPNPIPIAGPAAGSGAPAHPPPAHPAHAAGNPFGQASGHVPAPNAQLGNQDANVAAAVARVSANAAAIADTIERAQRRLGDSRRYRRTAERLEAEAQQARENEELAFQQAQEMLQNLNLG